MCCPKMYALVLFTDYVLSICQSTDVSAFKKKCPAVKYTDGKKYTARILVLHEDRVLLEEIKNNLEDETNSVSGRNIRVTKDKLSYSDILTKHKDCRDVHKLYLDPLILPSRSTNSMDYEFSLHGQEETDCFFKIQPHFIETEITGLELHSEESPANPVDDFIDDVPRETDNSKSAVIGKVEDLKNPVVDERNPKMLMSEHQIFKKTNTLEHVSDLEISDDKHYVEQNSTNQIHTETPNTTHNTKEQDSKGQIIDQKVPMEHISNISKHEEENPIVLGSTNQILEDERTVKKVSTPPFFNENDKDARFELQIVDDETTIGQSSENQILNKENTMEKRPTGQILSQKKIDKEDSNGNILKEKNGNTEVSEHQIFDENSTTEKRFTSPILTANNKIGHGSEDWIFVEEVSKGSTQSADRLVTLVDNSTFSTVANKSDEKMKHFVKMNLVDENLNIEENLNIDKNCNFSATCTANKIAYNTSVGELDNHKEIPREIKKILDENDTTKYIAQNVTSENHESPIYGVFFGMEPQKNTIIAESFHDKESPVAPNAVENPNLTYSLELATLDLSTDNLLGNSGKSDDPLAKPRFLFDDFMTGNIFPTSEYLNDSQLQNSLTIAPPASCSTVLESSATSSGLTIVDKENSRTILDSSVATTNLDVPLNDEDSESSEKSDGDDYVPSEESASSDASKMEDEIPKVTTRGKKRQDPNGSALNITLGTNKVGMSAPDDTDMTVATSKTPAYTKKHFCVYCQTLQTKLARHLEIAHKNEEDVKKFIDLPAKTLERMQIISIIRKNGNHLYNTDKRFNKGDLLVVRRPQEKFGKSAVDFVACGNCKGQYSRTVLRAHFRKCTNKGNKKERLVMVKGRKVSGRIHEIANEMVRTHIFPYLREDAVVRIARYDKLIILYANKQTDKYGLHKHLFQMIRARIRYLGRFMLAIKSIEKTTLRNLADVFQPRIYDSAVEAVKTVAGYNRTTLLYDHPAVATSLGTLLKYCGEIQRSEYIKEENAADQKRVDDFLKLYAEHFGASVNRGVMETQSQNNRRKKIVLPSLEDITKLHTFLKTERETHSAILNTRFCGDAWLKLAKVTLTSLQVFNRRRAGEIERVYLEDFNSYQGIDQVTDKDAYGSLSKEGQALAKKYVRFMIRGKRGRGVPVLVPSDLLNCLRLVEKYRSDAGVSEDNEYLFGIPSKDKDRAKYLRACDLLRLYSQQCGAELPEALRGTQLRKHVATKCISLNLSDNQVSDLANFMGHADKIHKDIYRQPVIQNDIIKISQLLEIAQGTQDTLASDGESSDEGEESVSATVEAENSFSGTEGNKNPGASGSDVSSANKKRTSTPNTSRNSVSATRPVSTNRRWTDDARDTVLGAFKSTIQRGQMPTGQQMQKLIDANNCLKGRDVAQLRSWLHTQKKKM